MVSCPTAKRKTTATTILLCYIGLFSLALWGLILRFRSTTLLIRNKTSSVSIQPAPAPVLVVVVSIGRKYTGFAADSVRAYCKRHGYRLYVQTKWRGRAPPPTHKYARRTQKLITCSLARGERYVLTLDTDVVIAPWTPPIDLIEGAIGDKIGIVNEDQPTSKLRQEVEKYLMGKKRATNVTDYYSLFGDTFRPNHGMLNSGVVLVQPKYHCDWFQSVYYSGDARKYFSKVRKHYDQPVLGVALLRRKNYRQMHHAWNRNWVYYKYSHKAGGRKYELWDVWRRSYFMHFCWKKKEMLVLREEMKKRGVSFEPQQYQNETDLYP